MKNQLAEIDVKDLIKADWNYKSDGTEEQILKLCVSIEKDNSVGVLAVREIKGKFEVIDGNHRLEAVKRLGWQKIPCENFGEISKAKAITIARRRNHSWFDDDAVKYADLLTNEVLKEYTLNDLATFMPETKKEMEKIAKLLEFDWSKFDNEQKYEESDIKTIKIIANAEVYQLWEQWKEKVFKNTGVDSELACFEYALVEANNTANFEENN